MIILLLYVKQKGHAYVCISNICIRVRF